PAGRARPDRVDPLARIAGPRLIPLEPGRPRRPGIRAFALAPEGAIGPTIAGNRPRILPLRHRETQEVRLPTDADGSRPLHGGRVHAGFPAARPSRCPRGGGPGSRTGAED